MKDWARMIGVAILVSVLTFTLMQPATTPDGSTPEPHKRPFVERVKRFFIIWWLTKAEPETPRYKTNPSDRIQNEEPIQRDFVDHSHGW